MMKTSQNDLQALNQRMSILSERLRKSKIKSRGAPPGSGGDDERKTHTTSTIPQVVDMSPPAIEMGNKSQQFPSSSSTTTCETCEESAITCSKKSHGKDSTSSPVKLKSLKSALYNAETPRRDNISSKHDVSYYLINEDAACITPPTPNSDNIFHDSDYDVTASPEIDINNKTDDDESLLDSVLNEEMEHLISIDGIHDYEDVQASVTAKEEDDYSSLLSQSSSEYDNENTSSRKKEYEIDETGRKMSIENRMAMIREKVTRLKNQSTGLNQDSPIESTTNQNNLPNSFMKTDSEMQKRLDEVLKKVKEVQNENDILKKMNKRLIATLEMHGLSVLDDPIFKNDEILDMSSPESNTIDEATNGEGVSLNTKESRQKDDENTFKIKTRDEAFQYLFDELVSLQNRETESLLSYTTVSYQEDTKTQAGDVDSPNGSEKKLREKLPILRVGSSDDIQDLVLKNTQQRMIVSSLERQIKEDNFSVVNLESYIRALNNTMMTADHGHEPKQKHAIEVAEMSAALHRVKVHQSAEIGDDDDELESLTESEKEKLRRDIEEERRLLMNEDNVL
jgi:hypothetical protein